jgi:translation elongation factor EF-G
MPSWTTCPAPRSPPQPEIDLEGNETGGFAHVDPEKPLRALAFKIMDDRFGALTFTRIYSGTISKGDTILDTATGKTERIGRWWKCTPTTARRSIPPRLGTSSPSSA